MKGKFLVQLGVASLGLLTVVSCGKDKDGLDDQGSGSMEQMTPTESKQYLQEVGKEFLGYFNPTDQKEAIELSSYFMDNYGDLDMPEEFDFEDYDYWYSPAEIFRAIGLTAKGDAVAMSRASYYYTYTVDFERCKGIYEPGRYRWNKVSDSKDIVFRFTGPMGSRCEMKIVGEGKTNSFQYTYEESWYNDIYRDEYNISVPKKLTLTVTKNSNQIAIARVDTDIDIDGHKYTADVEATVANIGVKANSNGNDSRLYAQSTLTVNGKTLITAEAELNGNNLCNANMILNDLEYDLEDGYITKWFTKGAGKVNVLEKVQGYANINFTNEFARIDTYWGYWDYSRQEALRLANQAANVLNSNITAKVRYDNKATDQALIVFQPVLDEWGYNSWEYELEPVLYFPVDETTYSFEDYFENGFRSLKSQWESLLGSYEKLWR